MTREKVQLKVYLNDILQRFQTITNKVTTWQNTPTDTNYPSEKLVKDSLDNKLDKTSTDTGFVKTNGDTTTFGTGATQVATGNHTHGNLTTDGKVGSNSNYFVTTTTNGAITSKQKIGNINTSGQIGTTANKPLITTTSGAITTGSFGTSANTFCEGNDSRLSDARTPLAHTHDLDDITDYIVTSISCSDYNPTIDGTVTVTVFVGDSEGVGIQGVSVPVTASEGQFTKLNNTTITASSSVTGITGANGTFTLTYSCTEWGLITFSANNEKCQINVWDNWTVLVDDGTYYIRAKQDTVQFAISSDISTSFPTTFTAFGGGAKVPTGYRPPYSVVVPCKSNYPLFVAIRPDGTVERKTTKSSSQSAGVYCFTEWTI